MITSPPRALLVLVALGLLVGCSGDDESPVEVGSVERGTVVEVVEAAASVVARASAEITAPATGTIRSLRVSDGERVDKGEVLLVVDSPATERALTQAQQAAAAASGDLSLGRVDTAAQQRQADEAARAAFAQARQAARQIPDTNLRQAALAQIARAQAQYRAARAQTDATVAQINAGLASVEASLNALTSAQQAQTQAAVAAAQRAVDALTVRAPIAGRVVLGASAGGGGGSDLSGLVGSLPEGLAGQAESLLGGGAAGASTTGELDLGSPVSSGDPLLTVTDVSTLSLRAEVDETDVLLVRRGIEADVELDAVPGATYRGRVRNVDLNPTTSARGGVSYVVRLDLFGGQTADGRPAPKPRPGMSAVAGLLVREAQNTLVVPAAAVFRDGPSDAVWLDVDGVARRTTVTLGAQGEESIEVLEGLAEGDRIVVRGADRVSDGQALP